MATLQLNVEHEHLFRNGTTAFVRGGGRVSFRYDRRPVNGFDDSSTIGTQWAHLASPFDTSSARDSCCARGDERVLKYREVQVVVTEKNGIRTLILMI